jgi:hypothetical protein
MYLDPTLSGISRWLKVSCVDPENTAAFLRAGGLLAIVETVARTSHVRRNINIHAAIIMAKGAQLLRSLMDHEVGMLFAASHQEFVEALVAQLQIGNSGLKAVVWELLTALLLFSREGYEKVLAALFKRGGAEFIVNELDNGVRAAISTGFTSFCNPILQGVNAMLSRAADRKSRMELRAQLGVAGLGDILGQVRLSSVLAPSSETQAFVNALDKSAIRDFRLAISFQSFMDLDSLESVFEMLKRTCEADPPTENVLLFRVILQFFAYLSSTDCLRTGPIITALLSDIIRTPLDSLIDFSEPLVITTLRQCSHDTSGGLLSGSLSGAAAAPGVPGVAEDVSQGAEEKGAQERFSTPPNVDPSGEEMVDSQGPLHGSSDANHDSKSADHALDAIDPPVASVGQAGNSAPSAGADPLESVADLESARICIETLRSEITSLRAQLVHASPLNNSAPPPPPPPPPLFLQDIKKGASLKPVVKANPTAEIPQRIDKGDHGLNHVDHQPSARPRGPMGDLLSEIKKGASLKPVGDYGLNHVDHQPSARPRGPMGDLLSEIAEKSRKPLKKSESNARPVIGNSMDEELQMKFNKVRNSAPRPAPSDPVSLGCLHIQFNIIFLNE